MTAPEVGTFAHEPLLPRVPLPALEDSARRFLEWCSPLLTPDELAVTEQAVAAFLAADSPAHALQAALEEYDARPDVDSWLDDFWRQRYLGRRDRIALNANFFFLFEDAPQDQVHRAAALVAAALHYKSELDQERLPPVVQRGRALSMEQTRYLFSATRIPGHGQDTVRSPYSQAEPGPSTARHVLVLHRGHAHALDVLGQDGVPHTLEELQAGLRSVLEQTATDAPPGTSVGSLTTLGREDWATTREALLDLAPDNRAALDVVETALLCVCLEDAVPRDTHQACDLLLHGDSANRWFDKALSFIVFADGRAGLNAEHARLDGTTILDLVDAVLVERSSPTSAEPAAVPGVRPVAFVLDAPLRAAVEEAASAFAAYAADTATAVLSFPDVGTERIKALRTSPDAFVQLAYQLAHVRAKGLVGTTYESIATRQYRHGRTEAMRVVTPEVLAFVRTMDDAGAAADLRRSAFRSAAEAHGQRARQCQQGEAPEQHLWELQMLQQRRGTELEPLALYDSPGWTVLRDDHLSTSSAPSRHISHFGFGSTSPQCIGVAYVLLPDRFNLFLSTPRPVAHHLDVFAQELARALVELDALLAGEPPGD